MLSPFKKNAHKGANNEKYLECTKLKINKEDEKFGLSAAALNDEDDDDEYDDDDPLKFT